MMVDYLPYGKQHVDEEDIQAVADALHSDWLTTGPKVKEFEERLAEAVGAKYVVALNSGTAALHAAYFAAGISAGDEVVTSPITFAATANAACYLGARPVFADVRPGTINVDPQQVEMAITPRTKVIAPVDFAGQPADLDEIMGIARDRNLIVVEDAAHALGARYQGRPVGSIAHLTIFSFHPVKHITTGEGGAVATDSEEFYQKLLSFRTHGIVRDQSRMTEYHGPWYHEMQFLGYNYRITDFQCALGLSQLSKLSSFIRRRQELARMYSERLDGMPGIQLPALEQDRFHAWHLFVLRLTGPNPPRRELFEEMHAGGIGVQVHYLPVYWHPYYRKLGYQKGLCPVAEDYYARCISLPLFPGMTDHDLDRAVVSFKSALNKFYC